LLLILLLPLIVTNSYGLKPGKLKGVYHRVKKGETLYSIARAYRVHIQDLAEVNNIDDTNRIEMDQVLFVPDATEVVEDIMLLLRMQDPAARRINRRLEKG
jgi:lipoprotein NlpD